MSFGTEVLDRPASALAARSVIADKSSALPAWFGVVLLAGIFVLPLLATLRPITDTDIWWHLRAGQWIVQEQRLPETDPFCEYTAGQPWVAYSWFYEVLIYGVYSALGLSGILLFRVGMCLAIVALLHRLITRREPSFLAALGLTLWASFAMLPLMTERPWLVTILFAVLTLQVISDIRAGKSSKLHWLLPGVYVLWANAHIQFVYGLVLMAIACAAPVLDALLGWTTSGDKCEPGSRAWRRLVAITSACALASLINPYHVKLYAVVWDYATHEAASVLIRELAALEFRSIWEWMVLGLALASAFRLGRRKRVSSFQVLLLAFAAFCTFRSRRDVWLMALCAAVLIPPFRERELLSKQNLRWRLTRPRMAWVCLIVAAIGLFTWLSRSLSEARLEQAVAEVFPTEAVAAINARGDRGPIFNDYNWGGYLTWALPRLKASIDGRANLHGDRRLQRSADTWSGSIGWTEDPELAAARLVLANKATVLAALLQTDVRYELVHEDVVAQVFVRRYPKETNP
jgi:hypothetical protein